MFQLSANSQNCTSGAPPRFLVLFHTSESRCGARHSTYRISNVIKLAWLRAPYWCDTATVVGDSTHPRAMPLATLTMKKETQGFIISVRGFLMFQSDAKRYVASLPGPSGWRSSAKILSLGCMALEDAKLPFALLYEIK